MTIDAGQKVFGGRYESRRRVGSGGMAEVYQAYDQLLDREVAVKALNDELASDPQFVERFRREARAAARLSHPNIVALHDYGATDDAYFIVMEFIDDRQSAISSRPRARWTRCAWPRSRPMLLARSSALIIRGSCIETSVRET